MELSEYSKPEDVIPAKSLPPRKRGAGIQTVTAFKEHLDSGSRFAWPE